MACVMLAGNGVSWRIYDGDLVCIRVREKSDRARMSNRLRMTSSSKSQPCEKTYCSWGATCVVSENGKPLCQCPTDCPSTSEPVCGSDNVTYTNYCHLRKSSCLERKSTRVKNQGACELSS
ncbi:Agrin [Apis cerana cerana]|uniref:Agrin n=1 Tax=Apis cerana cerana TaxID=94128 RepID=A0A2A3ELL2_APICC|nr:Agrin [Apis cerana cerana]